MITGQQILSSFSYEMSLVAPPHTPHWDVLTHKRVWAENCDIKSQKKPFLLGLLPLVFMSGTKANGPVRTANGFLTFLLDCHETA